MVWNTTFAALHSITPGVAECRFFTLLYLYTDIDFSLTAISTDAIETPLLLMLSTIVLAPRPTKFDTSLMTATLDTADRIILEVKTGR